ncbi:UPF0481 protein At3g47200-like [Macadamia integrifolia]|uniref:UPF0481 protein At3g47200-like n=1 Tax=Macadamia integrifolia TaxID=60698 RepID=UPI001C4E6F46|nr:UPF0481 protein At3g47200-like [Macadamia integrifolia]
MAHGIDIQEEIIVCGASSRAAKKEQESPPQVDHVVELIEQKLDKVPSSPTDCSIYRVPKTLADEKPEAYIPHMVSIGPFHHGQQHLQPTEARKMHYFKMFLDRKKPQGAALSDYVKAVRGLEERAYQCYPDLKVDERDNFVLMMVVDGCFILELLYSYSFFEATSNYKWVYLVTLDLILLENQLPMFVLEALYRVFIFGGDSSHQQAAAVEHTWTQLYGLIFSCFVPSILSMLLGDEDASNYRFRAYIQQSKPPKDKPKHLLDFVRRFLIPPPSTNSFRQPWETKGEKKKCLYLLAACAPQLCLRDHTEEDNSLLIMKDIHERVRCATDLKKASVKFEKNKDATSLSDIKFENGVLKIPAIVIGHGGELILRNLVAYEQYTDDYYSDITEYADFMDGLIDSREDVELLQKNGIIVTMLGDPTEVARLFNNLLKDIAVPLYYTVPVRRKLEEYYNIRCHKWKASLMRNYFSNPWTFISIVAAIILLGLTVTQTIYSALAYYHH